MIKNTYSVGQVNAYIKNLFAQDFMMQRICVKGEVSNCKYHSTGHIYFTLKDETASIRAIMFAGNRRNGLNFQMREGDSVIVSGSIQVYERDGGYQIYAKSIELDGNGELYQRFEQLKKELEEMGMFAPEYKQSIPKYIKRLGIVTAPTGAAIQDIRNISTRRNPYVQLILYPALVQGEGAPQSIAHAIQALDTLGVDTIIVGRGGGSIEDLWAFNEEIVARAIFECQIPVISAVGHETDTTIADFVADLRAPTPSAAAELAVYDVHQFLQELQGKAQWLQRFMKIQTDAKRQSVQHMQSRLQLCGPQMQLLNKRQYSQDLQNRLENRMNELMMQRRHQLQLCASRLEGVSPLKKLSSGYSFVTDESGCALHDVNQVDIDDTLQITMVNGTLKAKVTEREISKEGKR